MSTANLPELVTLVTPPSIFLLDERVFINLGILKIAAVLEQRGISVEHVDLSGTINYLEALDNHVAGTPSTVVGITSTTPQLPTVVKIIERIRAVRPDMKIILGGPHVTLTDSAVKIERRAGRVSRAHLAMSRLQGLADVLVSGDGEFAVFKALESDAPKLIDGDEPHGGLFLTSAMYETTPFPARHLVDMSSYNYEIEGHRSTSLIAQLGCPFGCGFCGGRSSKSLRTIRTRSTESIVAEVKALHERYGYTGFMFYDDELNVNKNMVGLMNALADLQERLGQEFRFRGFVKAELFDEGQARAMHRAGFRWLLSGFESGSPRILENINKRAALDDNTRAVEFAKNAGLKVKALMSVGHPGESERTIRETQEWLLKVQPEELDCTVITTYPGTPYYDEALPHATEPGVWTYTYAKTGDTLHAYDIDFLVVADYYKGDPNGGYQAFVYTDFLTSDEIVAHRNWIEQSVRSALRLAFPQARAALRYEHSFGQGANESLPGFILRRSDTHALRQAGTRNPPPPLAQFAR
jgi:anaerobic magnesium-protoporphyrin IX monomethyl ester cyclase